jgi:hypothetical protein
MRLAAGATRHHLAARQTDVDRHDPPDLGRKIRHRIADRQGGARGPLRVVAVRHRRAEHRHDAVAHMLVDRAAKALDDAVDPGEETLEQAVHFLGVHLSAEPGVADEVGEQDRHLPTLAGGGGPGGHRGAFEPVPAGSAILMVGRDGEAARRAASRQPGAAPGAEPGAFRIAETAVQAMHRWPRANDASAGYIGIPGRRLSIEPARAGAAVRGPGRDKGRRQAAGPSSGT